MKKKWMLLLVVGAILALLGACGAKETGPTTTTDSLKVSKEAESVSSENSSSYEKFGEGITFTGSLTEDATLEGENLRLIVKDIVPIVDPDEVTKGFVGEGVILNGEVKQVEGEFSLDTFREGQKIEVHLVDNAMMARSMPPQIPGASIISIKRILD